ncbi:hypothetical protein [Rhizohabitans arisaemae]|uniref:hypothetical protein n=1 Tax=Rhizohabitans arisaemae TaxID=2720610 RepID=UPI0024B13C26|nr:hypothetical protein [Rhizohabitans arisaemae]
MSLLTELGEALDRARRRAWESQMAAKSAQTGLAQAVRLLQGLLAQRDDPLLVKASALVAQAHRECERSVQAMLEADQAVESYGAEIGLSLAPAASPDALTGAERTATGGLAKVIVEPGGTVLDVGTAPGAIRSAIGHLSDRHAVRALLGKPLRERLVATFDRLAAPQRPEGDRP